ncbi:MAG: amino acid transporter [Acidobacteriota bacterium]
MPATTHASGLRRELGLLDAVGIGFGAIVGAGIFVVTGIAAGIAGPAILAGLAIAGVAAAANALSSAELAAEIPQSGGTYEYGYRLLSPAAGFAAGWMFLASKIAAAGTVAIGLAAYLATLLPGVPPRAVAVGAIVVFTALNGFGVRRSSLANLAIVAVSLASLLLFTVLGAPTFDPGRLRPFAPFGLRSVLEASALLFFAYTGYARIATLGEEVSDPRRTIPRATVITIVGAVVLYLAVAAVAVGAVGAEALAASGAPLAAAARSFSGPAAATAISIGAVAAMLGVILSQLLGLSRMVYAMARRGDLPALLAAVDARRGVPARAVLAVGAVAAIVAATGTLAGVASTAAFAILIYYGIANLAALRLPAGVKRYPRAVAWTGLAGCALLATALEVRVIAIGAATLAAGFALRAALRGARSRAPENRG